jgi:dTDP-4-amino-4,6-dideoxygalactose transaminase
MQICAPERHAAVLAGLRMRGVAASAHYVPLHESPAGRRYGRVSGDLPVTERVSRTIIRLPLWSGIGEAVQQRVLVALQASLGG